MQCLGYAAMATYLLFSHDCRKRVESIDRRAEEDRQVELVLNLMKSTGRVNFNEEDLKKKEPGTKWVVVLSGGVPVRNFK